MAEKAKLISHNDMMPLYGDLLTHGFCASLKRSGTQNNNQAKRNNLVSLGTI